MLISSSAKIGEPIILEINYRFQNKALTSNLTVISKQHYTNAILDRLETKQFKVSVDGFGNIKDNYISSLPKLEPDTVTLIGKATDMKNIKSVFVNVPLENSNETIKDKYEIIVLDNNDINVTTQFKLSVNETEVIIPIHEWKEIPIQAPNIIGDLDENYTITSIVLTPNIIDIIGNSADITKMKTIVLDNINISGAKDTFTNTINLTDKLREKNIRIMNGTPHEVKVTVNIDPLITREMTIPVDNIVNIGEDIKYKIESEYLWITVKGRILDVEAINTDLIKPVINLLDYLPGLRVVDVLVENLDEGISIEKSPFIEVLILGEETEPMEEVDSTLYMQEDTESIAKETILVDEDLLEINTSNITEDVLEINNSNTTEDIIEN
jgi:hypothetical protein